MNADLRERLDDLLARVPDHVVPPDPATSWRAGARRRVRRRVTVGAATVTVVALLAGAGLAGARVVEIQPADGGSGGAVTSYPTRIDRPLRQGDLPSYPGPIAGVVQRPDAWYAVSPTGALWRIVGSDPDFLATVSPDGTRLAYLNTRNGNDEWGIEDLRTGEWTTHEVGAAGSNAAFTLAPHTQTFWSPDSRRLLVPVTGGSFRPPLHHVRGVVLDGNTLTTVSAPPGSHLVPVGWLSDHRLGWLRWKRIASGRVAPQLVATPPLGGPPRATHVLDTDLSRRAFHSASLGLGGQALSVVQFRETFEFGPTGLMVGHHAAPVGAQLRCPVSWGDSQPWIATTPGGASGAALVAQGGSTLIRADPRLHIGCSVWAASALGGSAYGGVGQWLFGTSDSWLSWHWREVAIGSAVGLVLLGAALLVVRRHRRRRAV